MMWHRGVHWLVLERRVLRAPVCGPQKTEKLCAELETPENSER